MAVALALLAAVVYGTADFGGGLASRRAPAIQVALISQVLGACILIPFIIFGNAVVWADVGWGMSAGFFGGLAIAVFYRALAGGTMSVVAPVSALTAVGLPVIFAVVTGERPAPVQVVGIVAALVAIVLVSQERPDDPALAEEEPLVHIAQLEELAAEDDAALSVRSAFLLALLAGTLFAPLYIFFDQAGEGAVPWALVGARLSSIPTLFVLALITRTSVRPEREVIPLMAVVGVFDMLANVFIVLAFDHGLLTVVAVISSLYPAMTVILARVVLKEHLERIQMVGLVSALAAIALISAG